MNLLEEEGETPGTDWSLLILLGHLGIGSSMFYPISELPWLVGAKLAGTLNFDPPVSTSQTLELQAHVILSDFHASLMICLCVLDFFTW